jgi:four helix bundle protein
MKEFESPVYKLSLALSKEIRAIVRSMDNCDQFTIGNQMLRSSISIPSNIAEGFGRNTNPQILNFLNIAHGSCCELISQLALIDGEIINNDDRYDVDNHIKTALNIKMQLFKLITHYAHK